MMPMNNGVSTRTLSIKSKRFIGREISDPGPRRAGSGLKEAEQREKQGPPARTDRKFAQVCHGVPQYGRVKTCRQTGWGPVPCRGGRAGAGLRREVP